MKKIAESKKLDLFHTKQYTFFWISSLFSNIGTWMQQVTQPWLILTLGYSTFWVGFDSFTLNATAWIFTLWGGVLADNYDRKKIVLYCQVSQCLIIALLFFLIIIGKIKVWVIVLSSLLVGISDSLSMPSFQSIIPSLVPDDKISKAVALNSIQFNLSRILGPVLAGIAIAAYGIYFCYGANLISFFPFFLSLYFIYPRNGFKKNYEIAPEEASSVYKQFKNILSEHNFQIPLKIVFTNSLFCSPLLTFCPVIVK